MDKTASFVARNGPEFESRIRQNELGNPKFNFLTQGDPYHAYYVHKVKDLREKAGEYLLVILVCVVANEMLPVQYMSYYFTLAQEPTLPPKETKSVSTATQLKQQELLKQVQEAIFVPKDPPEEFEFIADPPSISALDLCVEIFYYIF